MIRAAPAPGTREAAWHGRQQRGSWRRSGACAPPRAAAGCGAGRRPARTMTQQYLAGELSVLLSHLQAVATTEAAGRDASSLRRAAETQPVQRLPWVTVRALALAERLCWDSLTQGDAAAFTRQAAVC